MRERDFIEWIRSRSDFDPAAVPVGPGDDAAVVMCGAERLLVTTDQLLDGVHFSLADHGPASAGRKAMARGLSDVAAMAAVPLGSVVAVTLPRAMVQDEAEAIYAGLRETADKFRCPIVGGDVAVREGGLMIAVTVFARPAGVEPVLRSGAEAGDAICVTGSFGGAWKTQRHLHFTPRIDEARILASRHKLHAMIDVSDGLAADLAQICKASGVGAEVIAPSVPVHADAEATCGDSSPLTAALGDGEDYELLFTLPGGQADQLLRDQPVGVRVSRIGTVVAERQLTLIKDDGRREPLEPAGWEHRT